MAAAQPGHGQATYDEVEREISGRLVVLGFAVVCWLALALLAAFFFGTASAEGNEFSGVRRTTLAFMILWGLGIASSMAMLPSLRLPGDRVSAFHTAIRTGAWAVALGGLAIGILVVGAVLVL